MNININRPISPHVTIYKLELTTVLSVLHRITGASLSIALCLYIVILKLFCFYLSSYNFYLFAYIANNYTNYILIGIGFLLLAATIYHLLTGIRHLIWDTGYGLELHEMNLSAYLIVGLVSIITITIWVLI